LRTAPRKSIHLKLGESAISVIFLVDGHTKEKIIMAVIPIGTLDDLAMQVEFDN
jgi:hypothetical protein